MPPAQELTTGVDQLLQLINAQGQVTVKDAAKRLNVSEKTIEDWASLLEDSELITVSYRLANVYLARKKLGEAEQKRLSTSVAVERRTFTKGGEGMISYLDRLEDQIRALDGLVKKLDIGKMAGGALKKLKTFQKGRESIDKELIGISDKLVAQLQGILKHLEQERKNVRTVYEDLLDGLVAAGHMLELHGAQLAILQQNERQLEKLLGKAGKLTDRRIVELALRKHALQSREAKRLREAFARYEALQKEFIQDRGRIETLITEYERRNERLRKTRKAILDQLNEQVKSLDLDLPKQVGPLVRQRENITKLLGHLFEEEKSIKSRLGRLLLKGKLAEKEDFGKVKKEIEHLNDELSDLTGRRGKLEQQLKKLSETLK